jgi:glutamyl-Q tRNA(Asp) synthetase
MGTNYIGRFAPSPTGLLHFGSLVTAVGSFLQARSQHGEWYVRIEDLDPPREMPGSTMQILHTLETYGLHWDGEILYQSQRHISYHNAVEHLIERSCAYPCGCSRREIKAIAELGPLGFIYPGSCRSRRQQSDEDVNIRVITQDGIIEFRDENLGYLNQNLKSELGDFIIKRRNGLYAYQLAVVVDDAYQGITQVVRGADLLDSTARQIYLQQSLGLLTPQYLHLPIATDPKGNKLSKQSHATPLAIDQPLPHLIAALHFLNQNPPSELIDADLDEFWHWAIEHWSVIKVPKIREVPCKSNTLRNHLASR